MPSFETYSESGRLQISDEAVGLTISSIETIKPYYTHHKHKFYALQPKSGEAISTTNYYWKSMDGIFGSHMGEGRVFIFSYDYTPPPSTNYGIEVYDKDGRVTFSSNMLTVDILEVVDVEDARQLGSGVNGTFYRKYFGDDNLAVIPVYLPEWGDGDSLYTVAFTIRDGYLLTTRLPVLRIPDAVFDPPKNKLPCKFIVIDTKGY